MSFWATVAGVWRIKNDVKINKQQMDSHLTDVQQILNNSNTPPSALDAIFSDDFDEDDEFWEDSVIEHFSNRT